MAGAVALALLSAGCQQAAPPARKPDLKAEEAKILETDAAYMKAVQAKDAAAAAGVFAEDGASNAPGMPRSEGRAAVAKELEEYFKQPRLSISWKNSKVVISESGDLAYTTGTSETTKPDAKGKPVLEKGKFVTVWKKQAGGSWKVVEDIFNPDGPATPVK
jgi:uncharacterized protein (TIGR02246 family)